MAASTVRAKHGRLADYRDGVRGELRVQITNGRLWHTHVGSDKAHQSAAIPNAGEAVFSRRKDKAFLMDVAGLRVQTRRPAPKIDVMHHRRAKPDEFVLKEDRRENEDIRQVLTAVKGVVVNKKSSG